MTKVVLMSATIDSRSFQEYFQKVLAGGETNFCATLNVPGRSHPVTEKYLEDIWMSLQRDYHLQIGFLESDPASVEYIEHEHRLASTNTLNVPTNQLRPPEERIAKNGRVVEKFQEDASGLASQDTSLNEKLDSFVPIAFAAAVMAHIAKTTREGAILVFLPGLDEIVRLERSLQVDAPLATDFHNESKFRILLLHFSISSTDHSAVFDNVPEDCRKIILATNIAETSVTNPDVKYVVDTGKLREERYDQEQRISGLQCTWISQSNAKQRAGWAGRVQDGYYYVLFSKTRFNAMRAIGLPKILHSDLQGVCLDVKAQRFDIPIAELQNGAVEPT